MPSKILDSAIIGYTRPLASEPIPILLDLVRIGPKRYQVSGANIMKTFRTRAEADECFLITVNECQKRTGL